MRDHVPWLERPLALSRFIIKLMPENKNASEGRLLVRELKEEGKLVDHSTVISRCM